MDSQAEHEAQLMMMARDNPALFEPLYEAYFDRIYAYCRRRSSSPHDAEDLCSQVFVRAMTGLHTYRGGMVAAWLFQIAHNVVVRHYQKQGQPHRAGLASIDDFDLPDDGPEADLWGQIAHDDDARLLERLLAALPPDSRELLAMSFEAGLTSNQIGDILGKSPAAVRVQLHRVIKAMRERYMQMIEGKPR